MTYIAHTSNNGQEQLLKDHLCQTAKLSKEFSINELKDVCYVIGLYHDIGKYQMRFQKRIRGENIRVDHSICGALEIKNSQWNNQLIGLMLELCISGHHTGIPDCGSKVEEGSLFGRLFLHGEVDDYSAYKDEIGEIDLNKLILGFNEFLSKDIERTDVKGLIEKFAFTTRYCFSCLTDADSIDTMHFVGEEKKTELKADFSVCMNKIETKIASFKATTPVQKARTRLGNQAIENINDTEVFLMNMPTGSGKTLASMRCALKMALEYKKKRIIYVIPYNSIIDQTVSVFEEIFGDDAFILRHQSSFSFEDDLEKDEDYVYSAKKACENWDADIIVTTVVQFFESLYGNKRGKLRKVHNMADSVIIFDEAHLMPRDYLQPCLSGIGYIAKLLKSKILFLTATMPDYKRLLREYSVSNLKITDMITDKSDFALFKKATYIYLDSISDEELVNRFSKSAACLAVMNTRAGAREIYSLCKGVKFHLSTYMTAYDREITIKEIIKALKSLYEKYEDLTSVPASERIVVVSTSLIEAGVDLDFVDAYRELSGLDNIIQTGGRCNREGKRESGCVYTFTRNGCKTLKPKQSITQGIFREFNDITEPKAIETYYERLLYVESDLHVKKAVSNNCRRPDEIDFRTYSENFNIIDEKRTVSIVVVRDQHSKDLYERVKSNGDADIRKLQKYCCTVYQNEFDDLLRQGVINDFGSNIYFLTNQDYYCPDTGIRFSGFDYYI